MPGSQIDEITFTIREIAATRRGRLVAVTVITPEGMTAETARVTVASLLAREGFPDVSVRALPGPGLFRVVSAEFER